mmetsp:Transcript_31072/g.53114  ORF Transcript_31072/g.53114 Transcript_31072/m.53114 type:complete len:83 (-) Transcript_31072:756-1004(-)
MRSVRAVQKEGERHQSLDQLSRAKLNVHIVKDTSYRTKLNMRIYACITKRIVFIGNEKTSGNIAKRYSCGLMIQSLNVSESI